MTGLLEEKKGVSMLGKSPCTSDTSISVLHKSFKLSDKMFLFALEVLYRKHIFLSLSVEILNGLL